MKRYGLVHFKTGGEVGARQQRMLIEQLKVQGIIDVSNSDIEKWYEEDRQICVGCVHRIVLHDKNEVDVFKTIMSTQAMSDPGIEWEVSRTPGNKKFNEWVKKTEESSWFDEYLKAEEEAADGVSKEV